MQARKLISLNGLMNGWAMNNVSKAKVSNTDEIPFVYHRRIHWGDTDPANIVYTANFLQFALEACEAWAIEHLGFSWFELTTELKMGAPVVHCDLDFHQPLTPKHELQCQVTISKLGRSSISYHIAGFRDDGIHCFSANVVSVWIGRSEFNPLPIPDEYREKIQAYIDKCLAKE